MRTAAPIGYYPEDCDSTGSECLQCVRRTAASMKALTSNLSADWARAVFGRMYGHAACRQMEHSFIWACGIEAEGVETAPTVLEVPELIQIATAAA